MDVRNQGYGPSVSPVTKNLLATNDAATIALSGYSWATAKWTITTAGTGAITTEHSIDGGFNWVASAYSKRLDQVTANPSVTPWANNGPVAGTYETPLPANCTHFRVRYQTAGTQTVVSVFGGVTFIPGVAVTAVLSDLTEGSIGAGVGSAGFAYDLNGWDAVLVYGVSPTTQLVTIRQLDDAGAALANPGSLYTIATGAATLVLARSISNSQSSGAIGAGTLVSGGVMWKRAAIYLPSGGTVSTGRVRIEAWR